MSISPTDRLYAIVEQGLCIGCGLCQSVAGPDVVRVVPAASGYQYPVVIGDLEHSVVDTIYDVCPGTRVDGPTDESAVNSNADNVWGRWNRMVRAWASDPEVRFEGSTGGVLTALGQYLLRTRRVDFVLHVKPSSTEPSPSLSTPSQSSSGSTQSATPSPSESG